MNILAIIDAAMSPLAGAYGGLCSKNDSSLFNMTLAVNGSDYNVALGRTVGQEYTGGYYSIPIGKSYISDLLPTLAVKIGVDFDGGV